MDACAFGPGPGPKLPWSLLYFQPD